jgi:hypothetical protein
LREKAAPRLAIACSIKFEFRFLNRGEISPPPNLPLGKGRDCPDFFQTLSRRSAICSCERFFKATLEK